MSDFSSFEKVNKKLGFGCMRLPLKDKAIDHAAFSEMVDYFIENGFNYFDTAHGYMRGESENALKISLTSRYPRDAYILADKLSTFHFEREEEIDPLFESQLLACGVKYFDIYLMHSQNSELYEKYRACHAYEHALKFLKEGRIKHFGISFHDRADMLERILKDYPEIEIVQIQFNYADYDDPTVESRKCYEVCRRYGKAVVVMEPVKGGCLANLPEDAAEVLRSLGGGSAASYAIRFAAGFDGVLTVLSGMGNMDMLKDNVSYMKDFKPLDERERAAVDKVRDIFHSKNLIACTACEYCLSVCPMNIPIPSLFACMNGKKLWNSWNFDFYYGVHTQNRSPASACIGCGACESACPQHLPIRELLTKVAEEFEKKEEK